MFGGRGKKDSGDDDAKRRSASSPADDELERTWWREARGENSPYAELEKVEQAGFPGIGADDAAVAAGMAKAAAAAGRKVAVTDEDRELFQYARNMTMKNEW